MPLVLIMINLVDAIANNYTCILYIMYVFCSFDHQGWSDGAEVLLKFGAKCSTCDNNGRNALHFGACSYEDR